MTQQHFSQIYLNLYQTATINTVLQFVIEVNMTLNLRKENLIYLTYCDQHCTFLNFSNT